MTSTTPGETDRVGQQQRIEVDLAEAAGVVRGLALGGLMWAAAALVFILWR
jgi:hypothetical protein